jgi:hypothetical protein
VPGDTDTGELVQVLWINAQTDPDKPENLFLQARFRDPVGIRAINCGYELTQVFEHAETGVIYRIQLKKYLDVDENSPMKSYQVDSAKPRASADTEGK